MIIIPAFNEEKNITECVRRVKTVDRVLVVDDGSSDRTSELAERAGAFVLKNAKNLGKGESMKVGIEHILGTFRSERYIVFLDADMQYDPEECEKFLKSMRGGCDFAVGYRELSKIPFFRHRFANIVMKTVFNLMYGTKFGDITCGMRGVRSEKAESVMPFFSGYLVESEMLIRALKANMKICEIPVEVHYENVSGVKRGVKMVGSILLHTVWWRLFGLRRIGL